MNGTGKLGKGPKAVTCYICGRGYGTNSIGIHVKQCQKLFLAQEALKPKNERRALPQPPKGTDVTEEDILNIRPGQTQNVNWEKFNDAAFDTFNKEALIQCEYCGRTFLPDSLKHHRNACTAEKPARRVGESVRLGEGQDQVEEKSPVVSRARPKSASKGLHNPAAGRRPNTASRASASLSLGTHQQRAKEISDQTDFPASHDSSFTRDEGAGHSSTPAMPTLAPGLDILRAVVTDLKARGVSDSAIIECVKTSLQSA